MNNLDFTQIELKKLITHHVGNKLRDEKFHLSKEESVVEQDSKNHLLKYFLSSAKTDELYGFTHAVRLEMNDVYVLIRNMLADLDFFVNHSQSIAKLLYEQSVHPKIQEGQLNIAYFSNAVVNGQAVDAIGLFKSETDAPFIQMKMQGSRFRINHEFGFDLNEMDKGCVIFNTQQDDGYQVIVIDRSNKSSEAQYWRDHFLNIKPLKTDFHQTNEFLGITKKYLTTQLAEDFEVTKADQIDLLNRSVGYFKTHETFDKHEFEEKVFGNTDLRASFKKFDQTYRTENDVELADNFDISGAAVKKQAKVFKSVLKLDKNFHIYIHGNRELIEQGVDNNGRKYYKIYYDSES